MPSYGLFAATLRVIAVQVAIPVRLSPPSQAVVYDNYKQINFRPILVISTRSDSNCGSADHWQGFETSSRIRSYDCIDYVQL